MSPSTAITTTPGARAVMRPTKGTLFWRTFVPWQFIRFLLVNLRMTAMILKSHDTKLTRGPLNKAGESSRPAQPRLP